MPKLAKFKSYFTNKEILKRFLITLVLVFFVRVLYKVPAPGIDPDALKTIFGSQGNGFFNVVDVLAGGTLSSFSIVSVGLISFINASIIFQLLGSIIPKLEQIQKMGETGQKLINQWTRLLTVPLAALQSFGIYLLLKSNNNLSGQQLIDELPTFRVVSLIFVLTAGAMLLMWIAEIISESGLGGRKGGGSSVIITVGILSGLTTSITQAFTNSTTSGLLKNIWLAFGVEFLLFIILGLLLFLFAYLGKLVFRISKKPVRMIAFVFYLALLSIIPIAIYIISNHDTVLTENIRLVIQNNLARLDNVEYRFGFYLGVSLQLIGLITFFNEAERRIGIKFINRIRGNKSSKISEESSFLPVKFLAPGVIPIIFASTIMLLPQIIQRLVGSQLAERSERASRFVDYLANDWLNQQTSVYFYILQFMLIIAFSYFFVFIIMKPENVAESIRRSQSFIPGIRPGKETVDYFTRVITKMAFWGGMFLAVISSLPFIFGIYNSTTTSGLETFVAGGTSIIIVVSSLLAIKNQLDAMVLTKNYERFEEI